MILLEVGNLWVISLSVAFFLVIMLILVGVLLYARAKLVPSGPVALTINQEKTFTVESGSTLLTTLMQQGIYLPSACGGGGT